MKYDLGPLYAMAAALVCAAASWYLLKELGPLLRPVTLAVFLVYTVLPLERSLRQSVPAIVAGPLLALCCGGDTGLVPWMATSSTSRPSGLASSSDRGT